ncbi:MAG: hypothetical protein ACREQ5_35850, partial [Candidatus Dormibacteria bacterium]
RHRIHAANRTASGKRCPAPHPYAGRWQTGSPNIYTEPPADALKRLKSLKIQKPPPILELA